MVDLAVGLQELVALEGGVAMWLKSGVVGWVVEEFSRFETGVCLFTWVGFLGEICLGDIICLGDTVCFVTVDRKDDSFFTGRDPSRLFPETLSCTNVWKNIMKILTIGGRVGLR